MTWRLGVDLGSNSLGWAALELSEGDGRPTPLGLLDCGVRIFSDGRNPKDMQSNAAKRRGPRGARKNRDRGKRRQTRLMRQLVACGLMPDTEVGRKALEGGKHTPLADSDPWILRARALNEKLTPHQFGRALFHLHQRRGFKSNRKTDRDSSESGKVYDATVRTRQKLAEEGARTLGELFGRPRLETLQHNARAAKGARRPQPLARVRKFGEGAKWQYEYYPTRELILDEFDQLWAAQKQHFPDLLTEQARVGLRDTIEWQNPLKSPPVGRCTLIPDEPRAPKALPSVQRARIFQEVNALCVMPAGKAREPLSSGQRLMIAGRLLHPTNKTARVTFDQIRRLKELSLYDSFNTESDKRNFLTGDETAARLMQEDRWGPSWFDLDVETQDVIVDRLIDEEDPERLVAWLCESYGLDEERAQSVANCSLPMGYGNLSRKAISAILPYLEDGKAVYSEAVKKAGLGHHSQFATGEVFDKALPYYGAVLERSVAFGTGEPDDPDEKRFGKIANPTVHVALNQIRAVVNDLLKRFGPPAQIVVELARDLPLSAKGRSELDSKQKQNQDANDERRKELGKLGVADTYENRMRLRLYEELEPLGKRCVFSGQHIPLSELFTANVEIEHILPFSRTFDDSFSNKTLSLRQANRDKNNQTPYEAFGHSPAGYDWEEISKRSAELSPATRWRFAPDAMDRYESEAEGFLARQLTDTQYVSRIAKAYLETIYGGQGYAGSTNNVWVVTGRLTADLRWTWGLDSVLHGHNLPMPEIQKKNRLDHRHHAIDAIVVACTDRAQLKAASDQAQRQESQFDERLLADMPPPWPDFRDDVAEKVRGLIVSHKPDHGIQDAMHNDTAYGIPKGAAGAPDKKGVRTVVTRKPLDSSAFNTSADLEKIRDEIIRRKLRESTEGLSGAAFKSALIAAGAAMNPPVYKVRIHDRLKVVLIHDKRGVPYKAYKGDGNYCYDIWQNEKGKWAGEVISTFDAYQLSREKTDWWKARVGRDNQPLIMRLRKGDMLQLTHEGREMIVQVAKFSAGKIALAEHFEANVDARTRDKQSGLKYIFKSPGSLQTSSAKQVTLSPSGVLTG